MCAVELDKPSALSVERDEEEGEFLIVKSMD
jgi:hypothetical protein